MPGPVPPAFTRGTIQLALIRNDNIVADKFYNDHLRDSAGRGTLELIHEGIELCKARHGRQDVPANTILYVNQADHDTFVNDPGVLWGAQSNITVPVAITFTMGGRVLLRTGARFNYGVRNMHGGFRVYHYGGLNGGAEVDLNLRRYRRLEGVKMYAARKWPDPGNGWTAVNETVNPDATDARYNSEVTDGNGTNFKLVQLYLRNNAHLREGNFYYVEKADVLMAPTELWFSYNGTSHEL